MKVLFILFSVTLVVLSSASERSERQMFSSSGLVFPGPPRNGQQRAQQQRPSMIQAKMDAASSGASSSGAGRPFPNRPTQRTGAPEQQERNSGSSEQQGSFTPSRISPFNQPNPTPQQLTQERSAIDRAVDRIPAAPVPSSVNPDPRSDSSSSPAARLTPTAALPPPQFRRPAANEEEEALNSSELAEEEEAPAPRAVKNRPEQRQDFLRPDFPSRSAPEFQPSRAEFERPRFQSRPESSEAPSRSQPRRPNYPADYKPPRPQNVQGNGIAPERGRRPPAAVIPEDEDELLDEEEEEEVKPDKLQLMLQKSDFSCNDKKDGYYADESVECEVFHYCLDKTKHSWLCPEGASFHQVHLICMPANKDNICKKSSQFHFVNEYLYKTIDDEGNDDKDGSLYADRYYPEGYEPGVPFDMGEVSQPSQLQYQPFNRRQPEVEKQRQRPQQFRRPQHSERPIRPSFNENRRQQGIEPRRPAPARPAISSELEEIDEDELASHNTRAQPPQQEVIRRRNRPVEPAAEASEEAE